VEEKKKKIGKGRIPEPSDAMKGRKIAAPRGRGSIPWSRDKS